MNYDDEVTRLSVDQLQKLLGQEVVLYDSVFRICGKLDKCITDGDLFIVSDASYNAFGTFRENQVTEIWKIDRDLPWKISLI